jgi:hypothetical protein
MLAAKAAIYRRSTAIQFVLIPSKSMIKLP